MRIKVQKAEIRALLFAAGLLFLAVAVCTVWWQKGRLPMSSEFERFLQANQIAGGVLAVYRDDQVERVIAKGVLLATGEPVRNDTRFPVASLSKPLTAAAVRRLIAMGRLRLDERLVSVLPFLPYADKKSHSQITIRHLLQHTAGLHGVDAEDPMFYNRRVQGCDSAINLDVRRQPVVGPGLITEYSNVGYCILGAIISEKEKLPYALGVRRLLSSHEELFEKSITLGPANSEANVHLPLGFQGYELLGAAGGWFSDAASLATVLGREMKDQYGSIALSGPPARKGGHHYGLGWRVWPDRKGVLAHYGFLPGTFSVAISIEGKGVAIALLSGTPPNPDTGLAAFVSMMVRNM